MKWYVTKIVYRIVCGDGDHTAQFDEQLRLIFATGAEEAFDKALAIGHAEAETFYNQRQEVVQWQFINVPELYQMQELIDGAEVYSRITEVDNAEGYINFVHHKAEALQEKNSLELLNLL